MGRAIARKLSQEGASVGIFDISVDDASLTLEDLVSNGGAGRVAVGDITNEDEVKSAIGDLIGSLGSPSVVVNAAQVTWFSHFGEQSLAQWNHLMAVNVTGKFLVSRSVLPNLLGTGGSILNIVGTSGLIGLAYSTLLGAASAAVIQLTKSMAFEYQDRGVRINAIAIGGVDPSKLAHLGFPSGAAPRHMERMLSPLGVPSPEEVADAVAFLGSQEARSITGAILTMDGGISA